MKRHWFVCFTGVLAGAFAVTHSSHAALMNTNDGIVAAIALSETVAGGDSQSQLSFPGGENPTLAFDGTTSTKFLSFAGATDDGDATDTGILLLFPRPVTIQEIRFGFANDGPERDAGAFTLEGSNTVSLASFMTTGEVIPGVIGAAPELISDASEWTAIVGGSAGPAGRTGMAEITDTFFDAINSRLAFTDEAPFNRSATAFTNTTAYSAYRLLFPELRLPGNGIFQVGEIELLAPDAVPEPASAALLAGAVAGFGAVSRRRKAA
ncbi:MAG: PEP-CTERM sorting domain-containing protein [Planctomycetota bacterium]